MTSMAQTTKFTVVIPTRERCNTLYWALQTCVTQQYANLEIIVSDNASQDSTHDVVMRFNDPRIRYINTGQRVSMTANWEFALGHVGDSYVMFIGDDDGLMPEALHDLDRLIRKTKTQAISWEKVYYYWPSYWDETLRDILSMPLRAGHQTLDAAEMLQRVLVSQRTYLHLPCIYNGFVHRDVIRRAQHGAERFFHSMIPDVYSSIALTSVLDTYLYSMRPYSIAGMSGHSAGSSFLHAYHMPKPKRSTESSQHTPVPTASAAHFFAENDLAFHPKLVISSAVAIFTAESFLQATDFVPEVRRFHLDMRSVLTNAVKEAVISPPKKYEAIINSVREIGAINDLQVFVENLITQNPNTPVEIKLTFGLNILHRTLRIRTEDFSVYNIFTAAQLYHHILTLNKHRYFALTNIIRTSADIGLKLAKRWLKRKFCGAKG